MISRKTPINNDDSGFTLLELLVVVAMIGIISAIAAPGWLSFVRRQQMNSIRTEVMAVLRDAQQSAQSLQRDRQVDFLSADFSISVNGSVTELGSDTARDKFNLVTPSDSLTFDHDGRVNEDLIFPFAVEITNPDSTAKSCVIVTTLLGGLKTANNEMCDDFDSDPT